MKQDDWSEDIKALTEFFASVPIPDHPIVINPATTVMEPAKFIESHLQTVRQNNGKSSFHPYLQRLNQLKRSLEQSQ